MHKVGHRIPSSTLVRTNHTQQYKGCTHVIYVESKTINTLQKDTVVVCVELSLLAEPHVQEFTIMGSDLTTKSDCFVVNVAASNLMGETQPPDNCLMFTDDLFQIHHKYTSDGYRHIRPKAEVSIITLPGKKSTSSLADNNTEQCLS